MWEKESVASVREGETERRLCQHGSKLDRNMSAPLTSESSGLPRWLGGKESAC